MSSLVKSIAFIQRQIITKVVKTLSSLFMVSSPLTGAAFFQSVRVMQF